jgi:hypothetical protein
VTLSVKNTKLISSEVAEWIKITQTGLYAQRTPTNLFFRECPVYQVRIGFLFPGDRDLAFSLVPAETVAIDRV